MQGTGSKQAAEGAFAPRSQGELRQAALLLVSEDVAVLSMARRAIERSLKIPQTLKTVTNASDFWTALNLAPPDLLILDVTESGDFQAFDLLAALQEQATGRQLPVIVLATNPAEAQKAAAWPRVRTLIKPFGPLELCALLEESLARETGH